MSIVKKEISVSNLSSYIKLIESYPSSEYFFRGESNKFDNRLASAFRKKTINKYPWRPDFMDAIDNFYSAVAYRLSDIEKEYFIAFAQHYGLPTNLLDVTSAPLVALFFACYNSIMNGYVYIFDKESCIDITEIVSRSSNQNVFQLIQSGNQEIILELLLAFREYFFNLVFNSKEKREGEGREKMVEMIHSLYGCVRSIFLEYLNDIGESDCTVAELNLESLIKSGGTEGHPHYNYLRDRILDTPTMEDFPNSFDMEDDICTTYIVFLTYYFKNADYSLDPNAFPNMIYRPKITFERARLQQGYFLYQGFSGLGESESENEDKIQKIQCEMTIEIENTDKVLHQLDNIGINIGTLYGDFDNIARYIREKYN